MPDPRQKTIVFTYTIAIDRQTADMMYSYDRFCKSKVKSRSRADAVRELIREGFRVKQQKHGIKLTPWVPAERKRAER